MDSSHLESQLPVLLVLLDNKKYQQLIKVAMNKNVSTNLL